MRFEIVVPKAVRRGEPVPVTLRLTNTADRPLTLYLQGRPTAFDIIVKNEAGAVVWRRLAGQTITAILGVRTLAPGEAIAFQDTWSQTDAAGRPARPGKYVLTGQLLTDSREPLESPPVSLRIGP